MSQATLIGTSSEHWVKFTTPEGLDAYTFTGIVLISFKGEGPQIERTNLAFEIPLPSDFPANGALRLRHWAAYVGLSAMANDKAAMDVLWAVDNFNLLQPESLQRGKLKVNCGLAVRDIDGWILHLGYMVQVLGLTEIVGF